MFYVNIYTCMYLWSHLPFRLYQNFTVRFKISKTYNTLFYEQSLYMKLIFVFLLISQVLPTLCMHVSSKQIFIFYYKLFTSLAVTSRTCLCKEIINVSFFFFNLSSDIIT